MSAARLVREAGSLWRLEGDLTKDTVLQLQAQGDALEGGGELVVDLSALDQFDSTALALLLEWARRTRARGGALALRGVPRQLGEVAKVCGVAGLLAMPAEAEAVRP